MTIDENQIVEVPENGVYVRGVFLEGAGWDKKGAYLIEPQPMQLVCAMPLIHFKPVEVLKKKAKGDLLLNIQDDIFMFFFRVVLVSVLLLSYKNWYS